MKKYIVFSISFVVVYTLMQVGTGLFLTLTYTPDMIGIGTRLSQETLIVARVNPVVPAMVIAFLSSIVAYFIANKFTKSVDNVK